MRARCCPPADDDVHHRETGRRCRDEAAGRTRTKGGASVSSDTPSQIIDLTLAAVRRAPQGSLGNTAAPGRKTTPLSSKRQR